MISAELTFFSLENSPDSTKLDEDPHAKDLQETQTQDVDLKQVMTWVFEQSRPPRWELQGFYRYIWTLWNLFAELTIHNNILWRRYQKTTKLAQRSYNKLSPLY